MKPDPATRGEPRQRASLGWAWMLGGWLSCLSALAGVALAGAGHCAQETTNSTATALWDNTVRATTALGYRDNVMLSSAAPESSGFVNVAADASFLRFAESGAHLTFFVLGDYTRYLSAPEVDYEALFSGTARLVTPLSLRDELGGEFSYLYQHQVLDVSETEVVSTRMLVDGHTYTVRPYWRHQFAGPWAVQWEVSGRRQLYGEDLSDYWEAATRVGLMYTYGHRSELGLGYEPQHIGYDDREQFDDTGTAISGTRLAYWQQELGGQWRHHWDAARHWRTTLKCSYLASQDNASGYFDYHRVLVGAQLRWANAQWEIKSGARWGWYFYPEQLIGDDNLERRYVIADVRVERRWGKNWFGYVAAEREWNFSNDPREEYNDWLASAGLGFDW